MRLKIGYRAPPLELKIVKLRIPLRLPSTIIQHQTSSLRPTYTATSRFSPINSRHYPLTITMPSKGSSPSSSGSSSSGSGGYTVTSSGTNSQVSESSPLVKLSSQGLVRVSGCRGAGVPSHPILRAAEEQKSARHHHYHHAMPQRSTKPPTIPAQLISPKGNHYDARDYGSSASNSNSYHYSNR